MKKLSIFLVAVLLIASLFVSCDNSTKAVTDEHVTVTLSTGSDSRSLNYAIEDVSNLQWFYTAKKHNTSDPFKFGETGDNGKPITLGSQIELSQGLWDFVLWAAKGAAIAEDGTVTNYGTKVYQGSPDGSVLITKEESPNNIVIHVSPEITGEKGAIDFNRVYITLRGDSGTQNVFPGTAVIKNGMGFEKTVNLTEGSYATGDNKDLEPGDYSVTVKHTEEINGTPVEYASESIIVTVWSGRVSTVSGNIAELTGSAIIDGVIQVPTIASVSKSASAEQETVFKANVAPVNNSQSAKMESTTVVFEADALSEGNYNLSVVVTNEVENGNINVSSSSGNAATLDLNLTQGDNTVSTFNGKTVTITTYIAKGLTGVSVEGPAEAHTHFVSYNPATGELIFTTDHFSEYIVKATGTYEAYNATSKKVYADFITAVNELNTNDVLYVIKDVAYANLSDLIAKGTSTTVKDGTIAGSGPVIKVACTIDGMGHEIKNELSNPYNNSRLLNIFDVSSGSVEIKNLLLVSDTHSTWFRGISLANNHDMTIKLDNVTIDIPHYYAFNIGNDCQRTNIIMNDCDISGWNTVYNHTSNITLKATNCSFDSSNPTARGGSTNSFSNVIVAEYHNYNSDGPSANNKFTFTNCDFTAAKDYPDSDVKQVVCDVRSPNHNTVSFNNCTFEDLSTPQYMKVAIDTVFADSLEIRQDMLRTSHIYIDGIELSEDNSILNSYIDWDYDDEQEDGIMDLCEGTYLFDPIPYLGGEINEDGSCDVILENFPNNIYTFNSTHNSETDTWSLSCVKTTLTWIDRLIAEYAALTAEEAEITLFGEYVLDEEVVLEWPNDSVKKITINGEEGLSITGTGTLHFKYPTSNPTGEGLILTLGSGGNIWNYYSSITIG